uniref:Uncharacterized protein n=1 Tax=Opuntia streptacantha TaxID=393608 RepID=A0A7C9EA40_OPUST
MRECNRPSPVFLLFPAPPGRERRRSGRPTQRRRFAVSLRRLHRERSCAQCMLSFSISFSFSFFNGCLICVPRKRFFQLRMLNSNTQKTNLSNSAFLSLECEFLGGNYKT